MITLLKSDELDKLHDAFSKHPYNKPLSLFKDYFEKQHKGISNLYILSEGGIIIAYGVLTFESPYPPFSKVGIPEIKDLNVLIEYRNKGYATKLIHHMETIAEQMGYPAIGIGVGVTPDYIAAKNPYPKLGYISDDQGIYPDKWGGATYSTKCLDDTITEFCKEHLSEKLLSSPQILFGGALHRTWKVITKMGAYAIKELNPKIAKKTDVIKNYKVTEHIANQFHLNGLPAIAALNITAFKDGVYIVYPFATGKILSFNEIDVCHAKIIGSLFKALHTCNLQTKLDDPLPHFDLFSNDHWTTIIQNSGETKLLELLPIILQWNDSYHASILKLNENFLISHRDFHYHNVLWNDLTPSIIDWESAGPTNPTQEIIGFALEWSGVIKSTFRKEIFDAIIHAYNPQGFSKNTPIQEAFYGWLGNSVLGWTEFNIRRAYDKASSSAEQSRGLSILKETLIPCLTFINEHFKNGVHIQQ